MASTRFPNPSSGFGVGQVGQTYVFQHNGSYYESRVSFFGETQNLDITCGHSHTVPDSLDEAVGNLMKREEARACVGCHFTRKATTS